MQEDKQLSQLAILTQALLVLTDYLKAAKAWRKVQVVELLAAIIAKIYIVKEQLAIVYQSLIQAFLANRVFQLALALALVLVLALVLEGGLVFSRSISLGVATSLVEDSESNAEIRGVELEGVELLKYCISQAVKTVRDLQRKWTVSIWGGPLVTALDNQQGSQQQAGQQAEVQQYSLQLEVIQEIWRVAQVQRISKDTAIYFVRAKQRQSNCSLDLYYKRLQANRKTWGSLASQLVSQLELQIEAMF